MSLGDSSANRKSGSDSPAKKLLLESDETPEQRLSILAASAISEAEAAMWKECSPTVDDSEGHWDEARARLFKQVVEARAFRLYENFYSDGEFHYWASNDVGCLAGTEMAE